MTNRYEAVATTDNGTIVLVKTEMNKIAIVTPTGHFFLIDTSDDVTTIINWTHAKYEQMDKWGWSFDTYDSPR